MNEKLRFLEALDRVVGTEKCIRSQNNLDEGWSTYNISEVNIPYLETKDESRWWPNMEAQKENAWEVEDE